MPDVVKSMPHVHGTVPVDSGQRRFIRGELDKIRAEYVAELRRFLGNGRSVVPLMVSVFVKAFILGRRLNGHDQSLTAADHVWIAALAHEQADYFERFRSSAALEGDHAHSYSSTQFAVDPAISGRMTDLAKTLDPASVIELETDHHVTVKYGITIDDPEDVIEACRQVKPFIVAFSGLGKFANDDADVLFAKVISPELMAMNSLIAQTVPCENTQKFYAPHATIAYLKPGTGDAYLSSPFYGVMKVDAIDFSNRDRRKTRITLGVQAAIEMDADIRVELYGGAVDSSFWNGWLRDLPNDARVYWKLGVAEHCIDCLTLAAGSPYGPAKPLPTVPRQGKTRCLGNCRCFLESRSAAFFSGALGPIVEVTAIGAHPIRPGSVAGVASATMIQSPGADYFNAIRLEAAGEETSAMAASALDELDRLAESAGVDAQIGQSVQEIKTPVYDLIARGYRFVKRPTSQMIGLEAVYLMPSINIQGKIRAVNTGTGQVQIDEEWYGTGLTAAGLLFVRRDAEG